MVAMPNCNLTVQVRNLLPAIIQVFFKYMMWCLRVHTENVHVVQNVSTSEATEHIWRYTNASIIIIIVIIISSSSIINVG